MMKKLTVFLFALLFSITVFSQTWYSTLNEIRGIRVLEANLTVGCYANNALYKYSTSSTTADNGTTYLKPYSVATGSAGRWVRQRILATTGDTLAYVDNSALLQGQDSIHYNEMRTAKDSLVKQSMRTEMNNHDSVAKQGLRQEMVNHDSVAIQDLRNKSFYDSKRVNYQGLAWNENLDSYVRLGSLAGLATGSSPGNVSLPIQSRMKGCVLNVDGTVNYYLAEYDWAFKEDGSASTLTGADGNVMVQIPAFYYKYAKVGDYNTMCISLYPLSGYTLHPAFVKDGANVSYRYIAAYEAVLWDATTDSSYRDYKAGVTIDPAADKLASVSGFRPVTNFTRASGRAMAARVGTGWRQQDADLVNAVQLLMLIEYGTFYIQNIAVVGPGITSVSDWAAYNNYYPIATTGNGNALGNFSGDNAGAAACSTEVTKYSRYRGISNFYGHIWKWVEGLNVNANVPYVTNNSASFADDTSTGYTDLGVTLANSDGYGKTLVNTARLIASATVGGGSTTYITDYYYQSTGWRVAILGGSANNGASAGPWFWRLHAGSGNSSSNIGSRLAF